MSPPLRGITLTHPWSRCVRDFGKPLENRTWHLRSRGGVVGMYLAIHGGTPPKHGQNRKWEAFEREARGMIRDLIEPGHVPRAAVEPFVLSNDGRESTLDLRTLILPGIVAVARVSACVRNHPSPWAARDQWQFVLDDVLPFPAPIAHTGAQGLWLLDAAPFAQVVDAWTSAHGGSCPFAGSDFRPAVSAPTQEDL